jgi:hypothetical protein
MKDKTRQGKARQGKARQDTTRQDKTKQRMERQSDAETVLFLEDNHNINSNQN